MLSIAEIKNRFGAETALIVLVSRVFFKKANEHELSAFIEESSVNWEKFYEIILQHELRPLVYSVLSSYKNGTAIRILPKLKQDIIFISYSNLQLLRESSRLHKMFNERSLQLVSYKGAYLSYLLFGDYSMREVCDSDFIIDSEQSVEATRTLLEDGYNTDFYFQEADEGYVKSITCERPFYRIENQSGRIGIEIHWKLLQSMFDVPVSNSTLIRNSVDVTIASLTIRTLNTNYQLISMLCHHGVNDVWRSLKHLIDLAAFIERYRDRVNWNEIDQILIRSKISKTSHVGIKVAELLFGIERPIVFDQNLESTADKVLANVLSPSMISRLKYAKRNLAQHLMLRDSMKDRIILLKNYASILFKPSPDDMKFVRLPNSLFFVYYVIKPFRIIGTRLTFIK